MVWFLTKNERRVEHGAPGGQSRLMSATCYGNSCAWSNRWYHRTISALELYSHYVFRVLYDLSL